MHLPKVTLLIFLLVSFNRTVVLADNPYIYKRFQSPAYEVTSFVDSHAVSQSLPSQPQIKDGETIEVLPAMGIPKAEEPLPMIKEFHAAAPTLKPESFMPEKKQKVMNGSATHPIHPSRYVYKRNALPKQEQQQEKPLASKKPYKVTLMEKKPIKQQIGVTQNYLCALGALYGVPCHQIENANIPYENAFQQSQLTSVAEDAPYIIEPKTHRMWFTSPDSPKEVPKNRLAYYRKSLAFYEGKPFEHHFWCNGVHLIPQTIRIIKKFDVPVVIHDINEIIDQFITKNLFLKLLNDGLFSFASDLARQEILVQEGGLYADIGLEQIRDIEPYFKKYERLQAKVSGGGIDTHFIAASKNSTFYSTSLQAIVPFMQQAALNNIQIPYDRVHSFFEIDTWRIVIAMIPISADRLGYTLEKRDYIWRGLKSWWSDIARVTIDYIIDTASPESDRNSSALND